VKLLAALVLLSVMVVAQVAGARLGEGLSLSTSNPSFQRTNVAATASTDSYSICEVNDGAVVITEYVNSAGVVFAVKWQGQYQPDLHEFFGQYYAEYQQGRDANIPTHRGASSHAVTTDNIRVAIAGHMGSMTGFASVPASLPRGVNVEQFK